MSVHFNLLGSDKASPLPRPHALERRGRVAWAPGDPHLALPTARPAETAQGPLSGCGAPRISLLTQNAWPAAGSANTSKRPQAPAEPPSRWAPSQPMCPSERAGRMSAPEAAV